MRVEEMLWIGDGFSSGKDQVGRKVNINGKKGIVVDGTDLTIKIKWDTFWSKLFK